MGRKSPRTSFRSEPVVVRASARWRSTACEPVPLEARERFRRAADRRVPGAWRTWGSVPVRCVRGALLSALRAWGFRAKESDERDSPLGGMLKLLILQWLNRNVLVGPNAPVIQTLLPVSLAPPDMARMPAATLQQVAE